MELKTLPFRRKVLPESKEDDEAAGKESYCDGSAAVELESHDELMVGIRSFRRSVWRRISTDCKSQRHSFARSTDRGLLCLIHLYLVCLHAVKLVTLQICILEL
jgi:hypothetical protein